MRTWAATVVVFLAAACGPGGTPVSTDGYNVGAVTVTFRAEPSRARVGQAVTLRLRAVNNAGQDVDVTFPSGQRYDYWVTGDDGEVWRWSEGMFFTQALVTETIEAQSSLSFPETWTPEAAGTFTAHARLTADGYDRELTGEVVVR